MTGDEGSPKEEEGKKKRREGKGIEVLKTQNQSERGE